LKNGWLNLIVKILLVLGFFAGILVSYLMILQSASAVDALSMERYGDHSLTVFSVILGVLFVLGAMCICITLFVMMCSLDSDPFVQKNVFCLRLMGCVAVAMSVWCFLLLLVPANTILAQFVGVIVLLCGLFSLVLANVFERAVAYKQENDLTV